METPSLTLHPIGIVRTPYTDRYRAPRQPGVGSAGAEGEIILHPGHNYEQALADLEGFERIWVIYWFHRNTAWKPKVLPPRGPRRKRGLFATRSPHRPNPIGLSLLRLLDVRGRVIRVADVDLLDGTPVLDIKPYLPYAEAFPNAGAGWLDEVIAGEAEHGEERYTISWSHEAAEQAEWLAEEFGITIEEAAASVLRRDPEPHPYRRITPLGEERFQLGIKSWRVIFRVEEELVVVERIASGYDSEKLEENAHDYEAHVEFHRRWSEENDE